MMSAHWAASAAARTSSSLASGRPMRMLSASVPLNRRSFWNTKATVSISSAVGTARTSAPPTATVPSCGSQKRGMRLASVLFPPPEGPTSATVAPAGTSNVTSRTAGTAAPG